MPLLSFPSLDDAAARFREARRAAKQAVVADGVVSVEGEPARKASHGELAQGRKILRTVDDKAVLRKPAEFTVMGSSPKRLDARAKVTGEAQFAGDIRLPGMLYACVLRPPAHGATLTRLDTSEAARLAKITGKPVQVTFSRAEEFFHDTFDPACVVRLTSALDGAGTITLWDYHVIAAGDRGAELFYDVPNVSIKVSGGWMGRGPELHPFGVGPWRAPGANMNVFAKESQVDIMAAAAGIDPVELRLRKRVRAALAKAKQASG